MWLWCCVQVYLSLPAGVSMTEGHCLICPLQHHYSATELDEDVWLEIQVCGSCVSSIHAKIIFHVMLSFEGLVQGWLGDKFIHWRCFIVLSCFGVLWCACLSPRIWTVCSWKHTLTHVKDGTWSLSVSHYPENWVTWLPFILRSVSVLTLLTLLKIIMRTFTVEHGWYIFCVCLQKAIMECDEEWAMNKKVVDLSSKTIRQAVRSFVSFLKDFSLISALCLTFLFPLQPPFIRPC